MEAKQTKYNGYYFRSRLEARWAVFFDALPTAYHYEYLDFTLSDGSRYLPDFYLPDLDVYVEVKHKATEFEKNKIRDFVKSTNEEIVLLEGPPDFKLYKIYSPSSDEHGDFCINENDTLFCMYKNPPRMWYCGGDELNYTDAFEWGFGHAVCASRCHRFEFQDIDHITSKYEHHLNSRLNTNNSKWA